jgi:hypothetical protein
MGGGWERGAQSQSANIALGQVQRRSSRPRTIDGYHAKAPCKDKKVDPSPVDRTKQGLKRSTGVDANEVPLGIALDGANRHDSKLLGPTLDTARWQVEPVAECRGKNHSVSCQNAMRVRQRADLRKRERLSTVLA